MIQGLNWEEENKNILTENSLQFRFERQVHTMLIELR